VSEDIDPLSMDAGAVVVRYRTNPIEDVHLVPHRAAYRVRNTTQDLDSGMLVDAHPQLSEWRRCASHPRIHEHARALWEELDLYPLNVQSPCRYGLGDWTDRWETFARGLRPRLGAFAPIRWLASRRRPHGRKIPPASTTSRKSRSKSVPDRSLQRWRGLPYLDQSDSGLLNSQDLLSPYLNLYRALVHSPHALRAFSALGYFIRRKSGSIRDCGSWRSCRSAISRARLRIRAPHRDRARTLGVRDDDIRAIAARPRGSRPRSSHSPRRAARRAAI